MVSHAHDAPTPHTPGEMPIAEQAKTFQSVMGLFKWGSLAAAAAMILLVMWFCTPAGFVPGLIVAVIVLALGIAFLRAKKGAPAH